jgi:hypothetical protein
MSKILNYGRLRELEKEAKSVDGMGYEVGTPTPRSFEVLLSLLNDYIHGHNTNDIVEETLLSYGIIVNYTKTERLEKPNVTPHKFGE